MSARNPRREGWVTVAAAAAELTRRGDTIDASNVSRYLARNPDVPQEKDGKFRFVDLAALIAHRSTSLFVADKRIAREVEPDQPVRTAVASSAVDPDDGERPARGGSELQVANLAIKQLELRQKQREESIEEGRLIPVEDLQAVVSAAMGAFTAELARQEMALSAKLGRDVGILIRQAHRSARTAASARLVEVAREQMHPAAADRVEPAPPEHTAVA